MNYTHLTIKERYQIEELKREGFNQKQIANQLGRNKSTISRELKRNKGERVWRAYQAHTNAEERIKKRNQANVRKINESAWFYAKNQLTLLQLSPEQIAGRLKYEDLDCISHESIYKRIYADKKIGGELHKHLRCQKKRRRRYASNRNSRPCILNRKGIENRPEIVNTRKRIGDWEGDSIIGAGCNSGIIVSVVERASRYTMLMKVESKNPLKVTNALIQKMCRFKKLIWTMTVDNGGEFTLHEVLSKELNMEVYFARPYHSYERGTVENTNGLTRQYFKKTMRFDTITDEDVQQIANKLNHRPRKCLGYRTPHEGFGRAFKKRGVALRI